MDVPIPIHAKTAAQAAAAIRGYLDAEQTEGWQRTDAFALMDGWRNEYSLERVGIPRTVAFDLRPTLQHVNPLELTVATLAIPNIKSRAEALRAIRDLPTLHQPSISVSNQSPSAEPLTYQLVCNILGKRDGFTVRDLVECAKWLRELERETVPKERWRHQHLTFNLVDLMRTSAATPVDQPLKSLFWRYSFHERILAWCLILPIAYAVIAWMGVHTIWSAHIILPLLACPFLVWLLPKQVSSFFGLDDLELNISSEILCARLHLNLSKDALYEPINSN
jgi:hypothetical protein